MIRVTVTDVHFLATDTRKDVTGCTITVTFNHFTQVDLCGKFPQDDPITRRGWTEGQMYN